MENTVLLTPPKSWSRSFTLIELIVVIIIVGILAAVGISQYSLTVEKSRLAEAKVRIGAMRQLVYEYYLNNGTKANITDSDVGVNNICSSSDFYRYTTTYGGGALYLNLSAYRCTINGKTPDASREYLYFLRFYPATGGTSWYCHYTDDSSPCFGLPAL